MRIYLLIFLGLLIGGCHEPYGTAAYWQKYPKEHISNCIQEHLRAMSESDHVQNWDPVLYCAVCGECEKLFGGVGK